MKTVKENPILLCILVFLFLICSKYLLTGSVLCLCWWFYRTKDRSVWILAMIFVLLIIPRSTDALPEIKEGTAVKVSGSYAILQNGYQKVIVYTDSILELDAVYQIEGELTKITSASGFYRFDYGTWAYRQGIHYSLTQSQITYDHSSFSIRNGLQKKIEKIDDPELQKIAYKILLNVRNEETDEEDWYYTNGFSYAGILAVIEMILQYFLSYEKRKKIMLGICIAMNLIYGFPLLLVQSMIFRILSLIHLDKYEKTGIGLTLTMLVFPNEIYSAAFLIPASYRLTSCICQNKRLSSFTLILLIQSILFQKMNPIQSLFYPFLQKFYGLLYFYLLTASIFHLALPVPEGLNMFFSVLESFQLVGSVLGLGFIFYLYLIFTIRNHKHGMQIACVSLLIFQIFGLFHPFAEITFINVGQGDSILLRMPLNSTNVLVDTGKPEQYNAVQTMLKAKGISRLDGLIITHSDNDHAGNQESVIDDYHPEQVITQHQEVTDIGLFRFYDLNTINNEDENESSIVDYVILNGMEILLMGDADQIAEEELAKKYPGLHIDLLKLSHHGSKTGSCDQFLDTIQPEIGIISSGAYSIYHHPSKETIQRLLKRHIESFDTKEEGDITVICLPFGNLFITSRGKIAFIRNE